MKTTLLAATLLLGYMTVQAEDTQKEYCNFYPVQTEITTEPGATFDIDFNLDNSIVLASFQYYIEETDGITVAMDEFDELFVAYSNRVHRNYSLEGLVCSGAKEGQFLFVGYTTNSKIYIQPGTGLFSTVTFTVAEDVKPGVYYLKVIDPMFVTQSEVNYPSPDTQIKVIVGGTVNLTDGIPYTNSDGIEGCDISYTRTYSNNSWQALYLPFDIEYDDWAEIGDVAILNNIHQYDTDGNGTLDKTTIEFDTVLTGTIKAHTPCVFRPKESGKVTISVTDATLYGAPAEDASEWCASTSLLYTLYGTYTVKEDLASQGAYALSSGGEFVKAANPNQVLNPYRIYLLVTEKDGNTLPTHAAPNKISLMVDNEPTDIEGVEVIEQMNDMYLDLLGRPVVNPNSGIYIHNGKKVYLKSE